MASTCDTDRNSAAESSDDEKIYVLPRETILIVGVEQFCCPEVVFLVVSWLKMRVRRASLGCVSPVRQHWCHQKRNNRQQQPCTVHKHSLSSSSSVLLQYPNSGANALEYITTALGASKHCLRRTVPLLGSVVWPRFMVSQPKVFFLRHFFREHHEM